MATEPSGPPTSEAPLTLDDVETPAALVDLGRVRRNLEAVMAYVRHHGLSWRPHVKTHKSLALARLQLEAGATGLTVATAREAEVMSAASDDLLLAYPPVGPKATRLMRLPRSVRLTVALDSPEALDDLSRAARATDREVGVLVELDVGMGRVGVPGPEPVVELAGRVASAPGVTYRGLLFYPGHIRVPGDEQGAALAETSRRLEEALFALDRAGLPPSVVSGGSTPTLWRSHEIPGLTEIRSGTCVFHDRDTVEMGVCEPDDVAYTVLASVVSVSVPGQAVVDAGSKALAREEFRGGGNGYGVLLDRPEVRLKGLSEEHGILDLAGTEWRPRVGDRVRIVPNHVCVSVNLQDRLLAIEPGGELRPIPLEARGRLP
jgi:D-serine deaminase-like pyridoxal phosphate-dependent protein